MISVHRVSDWIRQRFERRRMTPERALARRGEDYAHRFLQRNGYRVIGRNYRTAAGANEVDLIAWHSDRLVFVEVKSRTVANSSAPERAVTLEKQRRIVRAAIDYTRRANVDFGLVRFDVVAVIDGPPVAIELYRDAFGPTAKI